MFFLLAIIITAKWLLGTFSLSNIILQNFHRLWNARQARPTSILSQPRSTVGSWPQAGLLDPLIVLKLKVILLFQAYC